jgi:hypothetical protein
MQRKYSENLRLADWITFDTFEEAATFERAEIKRLNPRFNKNIMSSRGTLGMRHKKESIEKIRICHTGTHRTLLSRRKMKISRLDYFRRMA